MSNAACAYSFDDQRRRVARTTRPYLRPELSGEGPPAAGHSPRHSHGNDWPAALVENGVGQIPLGRVAFVRVMAADEIERANVQAPVKSGSENQR
jgi:hypothetical protein